MLLEEVIQFAAMLCSGAYVMLMICRIELAIRESYRQTIQ